MGAAAGMNDGGADQAGIEGGGGEGELDSRASLRDATVEDEAATAAAPLEPPTALEVAVGFRAAGRSSSDELSSDEDEAALLLLSLLLLLRLLSSSSSDARPLPFFAAPASWPRAAARFAASAGTSGASSSDELDEPSDDDDDDESDC